MVLAARSRERRTSMRQRETKASACRRFNEEVKSKAADHYRQLSMEYATGDLTQLLENDRRAREKNRRRGSKGNFLSKADEELRRVVERDDELERRRESGSSPSGAINSSGATP